MDKVENAFKLTKWRVITHSAQQTESLGVTIGSRLKGGEIIELSSDLGGGKTTLARGIARGLGVNKNVSSPTFTVSKIYQGKTLELHHYDFYRLKDLGIMEQELKEVTEDKSSVVLLEWADLARKLLPRRRTVKLELFVQPGENSREILISLPSTKSYILTESDAQKC